MHWQKVSNLISTIFPTVRKKSTNNGKPQKNSLAYLEMRLILARMLWSFDMQLAPECQDWDNQESWIQWDKKPLLVKLRPLGKKE